MEIMRDRGTRTLSRIYRVLVICLISLLSALIVGTIYGVFSRGSSQNSGHTGSMQGAQGRIEEYGQGQTFTGIGQIRVSTADPQPGMVIIFVSFNYYPDDRAFSEELALRIRDFRDIIAAYIGSFPVDELQELSEEIIKTELLRRINAVLRLGQIDVLFFSEFMVIR